MNLLKLSILTAVFSIISVAGVSQELSEKEQKKLYRQFRKEQKAEEAEQKAKTVDWMVRNSRFVLEADQLRDRRGNTNQVLSMVNFVAVDTTEGVIQVGSNDYVGLNGVGGITVEGPISDYQFTRREKNGTYNVSYILRTSLGTYNVQMNVFSDARAEATISSSWPGKLTYIGSLVPPSASRVYKGTSY